MVKNYSFDEQEIIKLHCQGDIELDATYSKGNFYKKSIKEPQYKFDLLPQKEDVTEGDCRNLPFENNKFKTIMFDPPQENRLKKIKTIKDLEYIPMKKNCILFT